MKKLALFSFLIVLSWIMISCASQSKTIAPPVSAAQKRDVSYLVPAELSYAKEFVQFLNDSGWSIEAIYPSKFNGFFRETNKAAFIKTDRGIIEVVFFDKDAEVEQVQVSEEQSKIPRYHKYKIQTPMTQQSIEGAATYFKKYRNMFIIVHGELNDELNRLFR